jgi:hypothetical protein
MHAAARGTRAPAIVPVLGGDQFKPVADNVTPLCSLDDFTGTSRQTMEGDVH